MKTLITIIASCLFVFTSASVVHAETREQCLDGAKTAIERTRCNLGGLGKETGFSETETLPNDVNLYTKIADVVNILLGFAGIIATILIIIAGIRWIMAGGNEDEITKAKQTIRNAVIGILIVLGAYIIVNFVTGNLIDIFTNPAP